MNFIEQHAAVCAIGGYWLFSAIVGGMPAPSASSSSGYVWLHGSLHILAGNLNAVVATKYPQLGTTQVTETAQTTTVVK